MELAVLFAGTRQSLALTCLFCVTSFESRTISYTAARTRCDARMSSISEKLVLSQQISPTTEDVGKHCTGEVRGSPPSQWWSIMFGHSAIL